LTEAIQESLRQAGLKSPCTEELFLDLPSGNRFGDLSSNVALRLSAVLKKRPLEIASMLSNSIKKHLEQNKFNQYIQDVKAEGAGFINFYLSEAYFYEQVRNLLSEQDNYFKGKIKITEKVLLEFVSANPTGPLSVAHARQAVVGDVLSNILSFMGFGVKREYYLNDEGNQINILADSVALRMRELDGEKIEFPENYYQGDYIYDIAKEIKKRKKIPKDLKEYVVRYILDIIKKELDDFGIKFDTWYSQKELRKSGKIKAALDFLKDKGFLYEEDGALWFKSSAFGDDKDRVVIKSDASYTYLAPDIAYHRDKYERGFNWLINFWGPDHHGYISRLKAAVSALGHAADSLSIVIVQLATIFREGKSIEMSTRRGQYITLREVLDEVGVDAARFFFLMRKTSSHLDFDLSVAKKQTPENPVYYVQYAYARISSILRNAEIKVNLKNVELSLLKEKEELALIKKILQLPYILEICRSTQDPYMLTVYLQEAAESFHKFYDLHRVLGEDQKLTQARIALLEAVKIAIACGLNLLGVSRPERM